MDVQLFEKQWEKLSERLKENKKIIITTHQNPDGDAIGSVMGLYWYLKKCGKDVSVIVPNEYPLFLQWLPGNDQIIDYKKNRSEAKLLIEQAEIIFHLDYNDLGRSGDLKNKLKKSKATKVLIDHHPYPQLEADISISDTTVSSTAEMVLEMILKLGGTDALDINIGTCLYLGIMTDTGCFSFNSSNPRTFELVSLLLKSGIKKDEIFSLVYDNFSANRMKLMGYCLHEKMQVLPDYNAAYISLSMEEQERFDFAVGDSEGFVNLPLSIKGIIFTALFVEREDKIKISLRSRGDFAVNTISEKYFNGGGHKNAAGGESKLSLSETIEQFVSVLPNYSKELNA